MLKSALLYCFALAGHAKTAGLFGDDPEPEAPAAPAPDTTPPWMKAMIQKRKDMTNASSTMGESLAVRNGENMPRLLDPQFKSMVSSNLAALKGGAPSTPAAVPKPPPVPGASGTAIASVPQVPKAPGVPEATGTPPAPDVPKPDSAFAAPAAGSLLGAYQTSINSMYRRRGGQ